MSYNVKMPKYQVLKEKIRNDIIHGVFLPGDRIPSEQELATLNQVSNITSKRALNELEAEGFVIRVKGSGSFVAEYSQKVMQKKSDLIALVLPFSINTGGSMGLLHGVEAVAKKHGFYVSMENSHADRSREREILLNLLKDKVSGIIYYPTYTDENFDLLKKLTAERYPIVIIDKNIHDLKIDSVVSDNYKASYDLTKHLIELGHHQIAFICRVYIESQSSLRERFLGYSDALSDNGLDINLDHIINMKTDREILLVDDETRKFYQRVIDHCMANRSITALQVAADIDAVELIRLALKMKFRVPEDLSIVGFDDLDIASYVTPTLTTVKQDFMALGQQAALLVFDRIKHPDRDTERRVVPTSFVPRNSIHSIL